MKKLMLSAGLLLLASVVFGVEVKTEKLAENIWRVRVKRGETWPESGMNRYHIYADFPVLETHEGIATGGVTPTYELTDTGFTLKFPLAEGERVYGLGDSGRDNIQRRPGHYKMRVENITSYIPMPMFWTTKGWGMLLNTSHASTFDIGEEDPNAVTIKVPRGEVDFYVYTGADPKALLTTYTTITGRPKLLPIWGYGFTFVTSSQVDQFELINEMLQFRDRKIPCDVMGLEPGWMETHYDATTHKRWDSTKFYFPFWAPAGSHTFPAAMGRMGMKLSLWLCCNYDLFKYEEDLLTGAAKPIAPVNGRQLGMGRENPEINFKDQHIEQGKAKVREAYAGDPEPYLYKEGERPWFEHLRQFVDQGASAFKLDGAWQCSEWNGVKDRTWSNGMEDDEAHNLYPLVYAKQMATGFEGYTGRRSMVYSAGGYAGIQQYIATWSGDTGGGPKPLASMLNLGLSGHPHQTVDMNIRGNAEGTFFGFLTPWAQLNSWDYWFQPWIECEEKVAGFKNIAEIRYRLIPYLYSTAAEASQTGYPIARPLSLAYPDHPEYDELKTEYMLGDSLLVGVYSPTVTLPPGTWYEWRTGEKVVGPCVLPVKPTLYWGGALYVKAGAVIPMWPQKYHLEKGWNEEVEVHVWPGADGSFTLYEDDGTSLAYKKGVFATTLITYKDGQVTVGPRKGPFNPGPVTFKTVQHNYEEDSFWHSFVSSIWGFGL